MIAELPLRVLLETKARRAFVSRARMKELLEFSLHAVTFILAD